MMNRQRLTTWIVETLREAAWAPLSIVAFYTIGLTFQLFELFPILDIPSHFAGGVAISYFYRVAIRRAQELVGEIPVPIQVLLAFTATGTTAIFWEFYENLLDLSLGTHMVRGLGDTIVDLAVGLAGALLLSLFYKGPR
jgi:hypothetical protein